MSLTLELLILRLVCLFSGADKAIVNFKMTEFMTWCTGRKLFHSFKCKLTHAKYSLLLYEDSDNTRYKVFALVLIEERNSSYKVIFSSRTGYEGQEGSRCRLCLYCSLTSAVDGNSTTMNRKITQNSGFMNSR